MRRSPIVVLIGWGILAVLPLPALWWMAGVLWGFPEPGIFLLLSIGVWVLIASLTFVTRRVRPSIWMGLSLIILAWLCLPPAVIVAVAPDHPSSPFGTAMGFTLLLPILAALVVVAMLLASGLSRAATLGGTDTAKAWQAPAQRRSRGGVLVLSVLMGALLLAKALHSFYWLMVWDSTYDPLEYLWLPFPILAVVCTSALLVVTLPGRTKMAGWGYLLLIPVLFAMVTSTQGFDVRALTEARAERVSQALESYHARENQYPHDLQQLIPWEALTLSAPVIIYGQGWCYDGGDDYYRLGYVDRAHWSDPRLTGRIAKTQGVVPDRRGMCEEEVTTLQTRFTYPYEYINEP